MTKAVENLLDLLDLEKLEENLFRGTSPQSGWQRVFGGQVIGQALVAASRTVGAERQANSLHGYFLRPGDPKVPIIYEVDRIRDGGSFTTRRVVAIQHGQAIFSMSASFQRVETGMEHQIEMPDVPMPEDLMPISEISDELISKAPEPVQKYWKRERPIELRPLDLGQYFSRKKQEPVQHVWVRAASKLPDDPRIHQCVLAYASDMTLLDTALFPHGINVFVPNLQVASLDHAMWFHSDFRMDEWLLYTQDSPRTAGGRGFSRGSLYTRDGVLVASAVQEGLMRMRDRPVAGKG
ncbi:acyl-CoA thioesterase II [Pseudovibrio japonicus]|uniref:Acyl-CoA thioesterase II n=1 Tax=Pseudovibrio japonicus TaxID=366534 RepID=A0ABQ3E6H6_9HYPH|nr:acyl-CoA thioesterase II [Pseudovibrio japonicus]GHB27554.1 acyl-CoA thioesterase II [Pseudovibrio japonicus]